MWIRKMFFIGLLMSMLCWVLPAYAELTKQDMAEIRMIMKEEIAHINDRIDGLGDRIDGLDKRMDGLDKRMDGLDSRIIGLQDILLGGFGILFTGMFSLVGFVLWDRRSALAPAVRKAAELEERENRIERALKEFALREPRFAEVMRYAGIL